MDHYSGKRAANGIMFPRKGGGLVLRDTVNNKEQNNAQFCNRIGCSGRINSIKASSQITSSEKPKSSRPPFRASSSGKEVIGSSAVVTNTKKPYQRSLSSQLETNSSESSSSSSVQDEPEIVSQPVKIRKSLPSESEDTDFGEVGSSSSSLASNTKLRKNPNHKQDNNLGSSSVMLASRSNNPTTRTNPGKYGLKNLRCNSVSDVVPDNSQSKRKNTIKKRNSEGESSSSSAKGKKTTGPSFEGWNHGSNPGISISDPRRPRNWSTNRDNNGVTSVRTQRSTNNYGRARLSALQTGNNLSSNESIMPQPDMSFDLNSPLSSQRFFTESPSGLSNSFSRQGCSSNGLRSFVSGSPSQAGIGRSSMNLDSIHRYNMDGFAEVLSALERIERDGELTYEQLLVLETSLFLNGVNFHDHHRDMRLDIDNMSYEELLALEERMGTVSTTLTDEALSKCLETSAYQSVPHEHLAIGSDESKDDVKCSICQEEYAVGDGVGRLRCDHKYHTVCVNQWLRLKNWCPICKSQAEPSTPPPSSSS